MNEQDKTFWDSEEAVFERAKGNPLIIDHELLGKVPDKKKEVIMEKGPNEELIRKTSAKWLEETKLKIIDPDGWDRSNFDHSFYHEEITKEEFDKRIILSTISAI